MTKQHEMTKREYLMSKGLAKDRGRFSQAAKDEVARMINKGIVFNEGKESEIILGTAEPRRDRPEGRYTFQNVTNDKVWDTLHTAACVKCSFSFRWCSCLDGPWQWERDGERRQHVSTGNCECMQYAQLRAIPNARNVTAVPARRAPRKRAPKPKG